MERGGPDSRPWGFGTGAEREHTDGETSQATALAEGGGIRADDANLLQRDGLHADEAVPDRKDRLTGDGERRLVEQVVCLRNRAREGALDREDAEGDVAGRGRLRDGREARQGD